VTVVIAFTIVTSLTNSRQTGEPARAGEGTGAVDKAETAGCAGV
jgi:hypothetical protein